MKLIRSRLLLSAACLGALLLTTAPLRAVDDTMSAPTTQALKSTKLHFLKPGQPDAAALLAPPPLIDSVEQAAEMDEVRAVYHAASEVDKQAAYGEKKFSVFNFTVAVGPYFVATNLPKTTAFFEQVQLDAETVTDLGKDYFKRPRPFTTDPSLANGKLEKSFSYPSGHSTESMVLALVLADLIPDQGDAIIAHARTIGWHRVQIARHYPSDIFAGRTLARAITREFKQNDDFQKEFAEVKKEIETARSTAKN
ncbi:MAG: phosphatase PAP2 family protein [Verrucomicrobiae bacterium]|nr:phosphatase PAP2 family protein [Verrucomicrobiae bacterium]